MKWFKFYGQEYLIDPKMMGLSPVQRALWITVLCLASQNDGTIKHIDEYKIMVLTGISPLDDEWKENTGFLFVFEKLSMITIIKDEITVNHYQTRQETNLTAYERVKRHREKIKSEENDNKEKVINDNDRIDKIRIDKKKYNIGKAQKLKTNNDVVTQKPQMSSIGDILRGRSSPAPVPSKITKAWQEKAFREMEYLGIKLLPQDIGRVFKIYKEEAEGKKHKATIERVISYLRDYPAPLDYNAKLKMFFKLISNGFTPFEK